MAGWWYTYPSEKYEFVSWDDEIPNIWKNKNCSKPPTRWPHDTRPAFNTIRLRDSKTIHRMS